MGGFFFGFLTGSIVGVYMAQNYQVVDIKESFEKLYQQMKQYEKPETKNDKK